MLGYLLPILSALLFVSIYGGSAHALTARDDGVLPADLATAFINSTWIWTPETTPPYAPPEPRAFRRTFTSPTGKTATNALVLLTADNYFSLFVDGHVHYAGAASPAQQWENSMLFNVPMSSSGSTLFAVLGVNQDDGTDPNMEAAGLLAAIKVLFSDGTSSIFTSDTSWIAAKNFSDGWEQPSANEPWDPASVIVRYGGGPWATSVNLASSFTSDPLAYTSSSLPSSPTLSSSSLSSSSTTQSSSPATTSSPPSTLSHGVIIGIAVGIAAIILILLSIAFALWKFGVLRRKKTGGSLVGNTQSSWAYEAPHASHVVEPYLGGAAVNTPMRGDDAATLLAVETRQVTVNAPMRKGGQQNLGWAPPADDPEDAPPVYDYSTVPSSSSFSLSNVGSSASAQPEGSKSRLVHVHNPS